MTKEEGRNERVYLMTMKAARKMYEEGIISEIDYKDFQEKMIEKYSPITGSLLTELT